MDKTAWINAYHRKKIRREKRRVNKARIAYKNVSTDALETFADQVEIWLRRAKWLLFAVVVVLGVIGALLLNVAIIIVAMALVVLLFVGVAVSELSLIPDPLYLVELDRREDEARNEAVARSAEYWKGALINPEVLSFLSEKSEQKSIDRLFEEGENDQNRH